MTTRGLLLVAIFGGALAAETSAKNPFERIVPFRRVNASAEKSYELTDENGPWMIMATTFSGDGAETQAQALVRELRQKYRLPAYTYRKKFDFSEKVQGKGIDKYGAPLAMKYQRDDAILEIAVLIGDYPAVDAPQAQKTLKKIKYLTPDTLDVKSGKSTSQSLAALRTIQKQLLPASSERKKKGPMGHAFMATNPLLPSEYYVPKGVDKLVLDMNKGVKHSLLDCPGRYTVKVATFTGSITIDPDVIKKVEEGAHLESRLAGAAEKAHSLTEALRAQGHEAYEFHDRYSSMVTIGSFQSVGTRRADDKIEINPAVHTIMRNFGAEMKTVPGQAPQVGPPKTMPVVNEQNKTVKVPFDVSPVPVLVPRRSISSDYGRVSHLQ